MAVGYATAVGLLALSIPVLGYLGARAILDSSDGEVVDPILDPTEPGYRALIEPSPTMLFVHVGADGEVVGAAVLALASSGGGGGSVLVYPPSLSGDIEGVGELSLASSFHFSGLEGARNAAHHTLHVGISEVVVLSDDQIASLHAASGPLTVQNPDTLRLGDGTTFPAGALILQPDEIPRYTAHLVEGESLLQRNLRQELVWEAWIDQLASDPDVALPGEQDVGVAYFLNGLAEGVHRVEQLPLVPDPEAEVAGSTTPLRLDDEVFARMVPELIPFPTGGVVGDRPVVRVLAGTADTSPVRPAARRAIAAGGQVTMVGNADELDHVETQIIYFVPDTRRFAESVAESLGFGTVVRSDEIDETADVIVVLGSDADL